MKCTSAASVLPGFAVSRKSREVLACWAIMCCSKPRSGARKHLGSLAESDDDVGTGLSHKPRVMLPVHFGHAHFWRWLAFLRGTDQAEMVLGSEGFSMITPGLNSPWPLCGCWSNKKSLQRLSAPLSQRPNGKSSWAFSLSYGLWNRTEGQLSIETVLKERETLSSLLSEAFLDVASYFAMNISAVGLPAQGAGVRWCQAALSFHVGHSHFPVLSSRTGPRSTQKNGGNREVHYVQDLSRLQDGSCANKKRWLGQSAAQERVLCYELLRIRCWCSLRWTFYQKPTPKSLQMCHCDKGVVCCVFRVNFIPWH